MKRCHRTFRNFFWRDTATRCSVSVIRNKLPPDTTCPQGGTQVDHAARHRRPLTSHTVAVRIALPPVSLAGLLSSPAGRRNPAGPDLQRDGLLIVCGNASIKTRNIFDGFRAWPKPYAILRYERPFFGHFRVMSQPGRPFRPCRISIPYAASRRAPVRASVARVVPGRPLRRCLPQLLCVPL